MEGAAYSPESKRTKSYIVDPTILGSIKERSFVPVLRMITSGNQRLATWRTSDCSLETVRSPTPNKNTKGVPERLKLVIKRRSRLPNIAPKPPHKK